MPAGPRNASLCTRTRSSATPAAGLHRMRRLGRASPRAYGWAAPRAKDQAAQVGCSPPEWATRPTSMSQTILHQDFWIFVDFG
ncbi:hypothetical protein PR202_gb23314 [Eleusine coracana subsp. coracana]|uniref:Uncharacterized protein n=1 Tax=Eleusine coracana subsp. coracana TaxID=191504 RepID=A0AAV5FFX9_ELECO|nr:hypothetical protein PR202_gb23314 [Eleusine coracana subsp. coracana]